MSLDKQNLQFYDHVRAFLGKFTSLNISMIMKIGDIDIHIQQKAVNMVEFPKIIKQII